jgi:hypothetical protein
MGQSCRAMYHMKKTAVSSERGVVWICVYMESDRHSMNFLLFKRYSRSETRHSTVDQSPKPTINCWKFASEILQPFGQTNEQKANLEYDGCKEFTCLKLILSYPVLLKVL